LSVSSVIQANDSSGSKLLAETVTNAVVAANEKHGYSHIIVPATKFGANYLGRVGAQLGVSPISDVVDILSEGRLLISFRIYKFRLACVFFRLQT
jgi:electron transfer flavoprotein alpha subunit